MTIVRSSYWSSHHGHVQQILITNTIKDGTGGLMAAIPVGIDGHIDVQFVLRAVRWDVDDAGV